MGYARSSFREFESHPRTLVSLDEDDVQLISKQYNSIFIAYEINRGTFSIKIFSEVVYTMGEHEGTLQIEYDEISKKKAYFNPFGWNFGTLRFDEKSFIKNLMGFTPNWAYKPTDAIQADYPGVYTRRILNSSTINKIPLECDVTDGSVANGLRQ